MKFLCAVYFEPKVLEGMSPNEGAEVTRASVQYNEELRKAGSFIAASALDWPKSAKTVRSRNGKIAMTDGPFAETKEVLGGFIFIEARDMEEAVRIASGIPMARYGSIEVRPEMSFGEDSGEPKLSDSSYLRTAATNRLKYLCAVYLEPETLQRLSAKEREELDRDSLAYDQELMKKGHFLAAAALQSVKTAKTVRSRGGRIAMTDGPFAETKEVLGGFIFIEARDMDEALRIASGIPMAKYGSIEVRSEMNIG